MRMSRRIAVMTLCGSLLCAGGAGSAGAQEAELPEQCQMTVVFPDWKGYPDDTLAMNSMFSFFGYHGQGILYVQPKKEVSQFRMYVNGNVIDTSQMPGGGTYSLDISALTVDGRNTVQVSNIVPSDLAEAVTVAVPYPEILKGSLQEAGIREQAMDMISDLIESDVRNGFTSASLAVIRGGRLVYENAWGKVNSYLPDGNENPDSPPVTADTMYDLASVTKMFSVNYAMQKLVTDGQLDLDACVTQFLGDSFVDDTTVEGFGDNPADLETIKAWKAELTIRDVLRHQAGFPADPRYCAPYIYKSDLEEGESYPENPLFVGNGADEKTRNATVEAICRTPLAYEPGTKTLYSDLDYMILGLVAEKITGKDLNTWLKETFWDPMNLTHITYNPLENGFKPEDCAATELNGNTRDGLLDFPGYRTYTLQGEVHDEKAWYCMGGISGHAGLFASAGDLAKLASVMLCGGYGEHSFFSRNVMDQFTAPKKEDAANWGLGWWRQGDNQRVWYFGTQAGSGTIGHQGWTGTLVMIDPERQLVIAYLTNRINSPVTDSKVDADRFDGNWFTSSTLGFVPQILSIGMDTDQDISMQLLDLAADMAAESMKLVPEGTDFAGDHPSVRNARSKWELFELTAKRCQDQEYADALRAGMEEIHTKLFPDGDGAQDLPDTGQAPDQKQDVAVKETEIPITAIMPVRIGQVEDRTAGTGCTVFICENGMRAGLDVRGGGPASRESQLLNPLMSAQIIHGIVLAGGSAYGLGTANGVMEYLEEHGYGLDVGITKVPLVAQADIFDLTVGDPSVRPDAAMGYEAARLAFEQPNYQDGNYGAGCGATVGKIAGMDTCMKTGIGSYAVQIGELQVGAVVVCNALGDVYDWKSGKMIAGLLTEDKTALGSTEEYMKSSIEVRENKFTGNTTLAVVITNAEFDKARLCKIAGMAHDGYARSIHPVHTSADGDSIYAVSVGSVPADQDLVGMMAADVVSEAIVRAVKSAQGAYGYPAASDLE